MLRYNDHACASVCRFLYAADDSHLLHTLQFSFDLGQERNGDVEW